MRKPLRPVLLLLLASLVRLAAQSPDIDHPFPAAVAPGQTTEVTFFGEHLDGALKLWTSFPARTELVRTNTTDAGRSTWRLTLPPDVPHGIGATRLVTSHGVSHWELMMIDGLRTVASVDGNRTQGTAQELKLPVAVEGRCEEGRLTYFKFAARKGQRIIVEAVATRLGSALDPVVRLLNSGGRELVYSDDAEGLGSDARLTREIPVDGTCFIELRDAQYQGGPQHRYRLRVGELSPAPLPFVSRAAFDTSKREDDTTVTVETEPNDTPGHATKFSLPATLRGRFAQVDDRDWFEFVAHKDQRIIFQGRLRTLGSSGDLYFSLHKTNGTRVAEAKVSGADDGSLTHTFAESGTYRLLAEELNHRGGPECRYEINVQPAGPDFALTVETDKVEAPAGVEFEIRVKPVRRDYDGPITLRLSGAAGSWAITNHVIAAKSTNAVSLKATAPDKLKLGDLVHFTVQGSGTNGEARIATQAGAVSGRRRAAPAPVRLARELDGVMALGIKSGATSPATGAAK